EARLDDEGMAPDPSLGAPVGSGTVCLDVADGVGTITLNRPQRRNAMSWHLLQDLRTALDLAEADDAVRVVVLTGAGSDFCVGADLARVGSSDPRDHDSRTLRGRSLQDDRDRLTQASAIAERLVTFPLVTVAAINGACAGAGLSLALATDIRVAADRAVFNTAFVSAGVSGDLGSAWLLTRAVGNARASSLILDPVKLDAGRALELGLVTEVTADLAGRIGVLTAKLAKQPLLAMQHAKRNLADAVVSSLPDYLRREVPRMVETARSGDARAAAQAFVNRRAHQGVQA